MSSPVAVAISDIHFNVKTRLLAGAALKQALDHAAKLKVPIVIAGDLNDTKAIIRAECANDIIKILSEHPDTRKILLVGNHDLINEKGKEHSLNFLGHICEVVQSPVFDYQLKAWLVPYQSDSEVLKAWLKSETDVGDTMIMHQGLRTAFMGEYVVDKTSLDPEEFSDFRVISGHYHRAQDIKCGRPRKGAVGLFSYIGSPYTITFAEANDGPKGFRVLNDDGLMDSVPTNLRKHVVAERSVDGVLLPIEGLKTHDLLWLKVKGSYLELEKLSKKEIGMAHLGHQNFKLDRIATDEAKPQVEMEDFSNEQMLDLLIDQTEEAADSKVYLKSLWREVMNENQ